MKRFDLDGQLPDYKELYDEIGDIGSGTYGDVIIARDKATSKRVAVKRFKPDDNEYVYRLARQEVHTLSKLSHVNIVVLQNVAKDEKGVKYMIMECMKHDLGGMISDPEKCRWITRAQIKCYMIQILAGIEYCHSMNTLHRDLKPANILISHDNVVKIADFGMCKIMTAAHGNDDYINGVQSRWYRSPEIILGSTDYDGAIDVWSIGCIFVELLLAYPFMNGEYDIPLINCPKPGTDQLSLIWKNCGTPVDGELSKYPHWQQYKPNYVIKRDMRTRLYTTNTTCRKDYFTTGAIDLIDKMLTFDPKKRIRCKHASSHIYFTQENPGLMTPEQISRATQPQYSSNNKRSSAK